MALQAAQQFPSAVGVTGAGAGQTGGVQAGGTAQGVDLQPGVVGQAPQPAGTGEGQRFQPGVGQVVVAGFLHRQVQPQVRRGEKFQGQGG